MKYYIKIVLFVLIALLIAAPIFFMFKTQKAEAGWWNDLWQYRKAISITNASGGELADFQVMALSAFDLSADITAGKIQGNLDDLRFTDVNGDVLPYWIEDATATTSVNAWVKMTVIPTSGATIYMYYGNPSAASAQNGNNVFEFFDDFGDNSINSSKWTMAANGNGGSYTEASGQLQLTSSNNQNGSATAKSPANFTNNFVIEWRRYDTQENYNDLSFGYGDVVAESGTNWWHTFPENGYMDKVQSNSYFGYFYNPGNSGLQDSINGPDAGQWIKYKNNYTSAGLWQWYYDTGAGYTLLGTGQTDTNHVNDDKYILLSRGGYDGSALGGTSKYDWIFIREYASTQPAAAAPGTEEKSTGPVAYWSLDDGQGITAEDGTVNNNDGTLTNMSATASSTSGWQTEDNCIAGKCLAFDGTDDFINAGQGTSGTFNIGTAASFSVWVKPLVAEDSYIVRKVVGGGEDKALLWNSTGKFSFFLYSCFDGTHLYTDTVYAPGVWYHVEGVYDGENSKAYIYVNGKLDGTKNTSVCDVADSTGNLIIGRSQSGSSGDEFHGSIDEVKIYPYARTAAQIKMDYNAGLAGAKTSGSDVSAAIGQKSNAWMTNGLVGYWKMDEAVGSWNGTSGEVKDASGNENNGTAAGNASTTDAKFGNGGNFDGTGDKVTVPEISTTDVTMSAWVYPTNCASGWCMIVSGDGGVNRYSSIRGGVFFIYFEGGGGSIYGSKSVPDNAWSHVVLTFDSSTKTIKTYVNGVLDINITGTLAPGSLINKIGMLDTSDYPFSGKIDELRVYNRALSPDEVSKLYEYAPGPVAYWSFNEHSGQAVNDTSGNSNNGTLGADANVGSDDPAWTKGKYGSGLKFDGTDDRITLSSASLSMTNALSVSAWIYSRGVVEDLKFLSHGDIGGESPYYEYAFVRRGVNNLALGLSTTAGQTETPGADTIPTNTWTHVAATWDGSFIRLYINGVPDSGGPIAKSGTIVEQNNNTEIGSYSNGQFWNGYMDEMRIYNYARTPEQVLEDMGGGHSAEPIAEYNFDEGYGDTAHNEGIGGATLNGTLNSGGSGTNDTNTKMWDKGGKFGKTIEFDGSNDYIDMGDPADGSLDFGTNSFSQSVWIKTTQDGSTYARIISKGTSGWIDGYAIQLANNSGLDTVLVELGAGGTQANSVFFMGNTIDLNDGIWHHITGAFNQATHQARLYIDGNIEPVDKLSGTCGTDNGTYIDFSACTSVSASSAGSLNIGRNNESGTEYFNGLIDEVKIYPYALTADEVKLDYNQGASLQLGSAGMSSAGVPSNSASQEYCVPGDAASCAGPVGEWNFNEKVSGNSKTLYDTSGNGNNLTTAWGGNASGMNCSVMGKFGTGCQFDGTDDNISRVDNSVLDPANDMTWSAWVKLKTLPSVRSQNALIIQKNYSGAPGLSYYMIITQANKAQIRWVNSVPTAYTSTGNLVLSANTWYFITGVRNGSSLKVYINGIDVTDVDPGTPTGTLGSSNNKLMIGSDNGSSSRIDGLIDQVRVYDYARTPAQIAWDYNRGKPIADWRFNECQGSSVHDESGNNNTGTINLGGAGNTVPGTCVSPTDGTSAWYDGRIGKYSASLDFDGTDDYVSLGTPSTLNNINVKTISAWIKPASFGESGLGRIIQKEDSVIGGWGFSINDTNDLLYYFNCFGSGSDCANIGVWVSPTNSITTGNWQHVVLVYDRTSASNNPLMYINGVSQTVTRTSVPSGTAVNDSAQSLYIGNRNNDGDYDRTFDGQIDDTKIFNYALTATQVKSLYNNSSAINFGN